MERILLSIGNTIRNFKEHLCELNDIDELKILPISRGGIVNYILRDTDNERDPYSIWINYCPFCGKGLIADS